MAPSEPRSQYAGKLVRSFAALTDALGSVSLAGTYDAVPRYLVFAN